MTVALKKTLLLVEDDALIGLSEAGQLKSYGYDVIHALSSVKALEAVHRTSPRIDLVLMDIDLGGGKDGTEVAREILVNRDLPILFLSSHQEREIVASTEDIGSYGYVVKNSDITVLDASIKMAFRLHAANTTTREQGLAIESSRLNLEVSEMRYRRLFESAKDGIIILDAKTAMIVDINPYLVDILGYTRAEILHKAIWDLSAFRNMDYSKSLFKELQEKDYVRYDDLPLETANGRLIHVEFVSNIYLVDGERVIQCNIRDIAERRSIELGLTTSLDCKTALLRELQHRTKNSFTMITSLISLRANATEVAETKLILGELTQRVRSISDLYSLLYETDSFSSVRLATYCSRVVDSTVKLTDGVVIERHFDEGLRVTAKDAATLGMIVVELLTNAIKYAFPYPRRGRIMVSFHSIPGGMVLEVEDDGIGFPEDFVLETTKTLGLHLVNLMVNQLLGRLELGLGRSGGTRMTITCALEASVVEA